MIDNEFIAHESGTDAEGRAEARWLKWAERVERLAGLHTLDGDQEQDGYSLDYAYDAYCEGCAAEEHANAIKLAMRERARQAHFDASEGDE